jgi:NADH-quinone oxidoreductase subunit A
MIIISTLIASIIIIISYILNKTSYGKEKITQYECGIEPFEEEIGIDIRERFYMKFYIIGIIYLIFDLETILLYPIVYLFNSSNNISNLSFYSFLFFMFMLSLGLFYEYKKDILN